MAVDSELFKRVLGCWASGVTIVTSQHGDLCHGMTASAFSSVSADPPLILICANRSANTHGVIQQSKAFCVNLLASDQAELSNLFSDKSREGMRFEGLSCELGKTGCPRIPGALASLDCSVHAEVESGTHVIYVGLIEQAVVGEGDPLMYFRGRYGSFA